MAASQNPLQGSLFEGPEEREFSESGKIDTSKILNENLTHEQLKDDASRRPRVKKNSRNLNQFTDQDEFFNQDIEGPKWAHHTLPKIDDLTPALRHYVELKIENPERVLLYRLGDFFECFFEDAITLSQLLEITLTSKEAGKKNWQSPNGWNPSSCI